MSGRTLCGLVLVGIALGLTGGCGEPAVDRPDTFPVTGIVTLDGSPVEGATVTFVPGAGGNGAAGTTDASGKYTLTTFVGGDGAVPGQYSVKISRYEGAPDAGGGQSGAGDDDDAGMMTEEYDAQQMGGGGDEGGDEPKNLLPEKYADQTTSGLEASVTEGENSFDFPLES